jgi:hypothetical protein
MRAGISARIAALERRFRESHKVFPPFVTAVETPDGVKAATVFTFFRGVSRTLEGDEAHAFWLKYQTARREH